jgi:hypothetical protein
LKRFILINLINFFLNILLKIEIPMRALPDNNNNHSSSGLGRSSSFESIHLTNEERQSSNVLPVNEEERKRQAKLRSRACNDSFRQAVDKSYGQNSNFDEDGRRKDCLVR